MDGESCIAQPSQRNNQNRPESIIRLCIYYYYNAPHHTPRTPQPATPETERGHGRRSAGGPGGWATATFHSSTSCGCRAHDELILHDECRPGIGTDGTQTRCPELLESRGHRLPASLASFTMPSAALHFLVNALHAGGGGMTY